MLSEKLRSFITERTFGKIVYFFGAGASYASDFKLPLMRGFFSDKEVIKLKYPNLFMFLSQYYLLDRLEDLNLEDVITSLVLSMDRFASFGKYPTSFLYDSRKEFDLYVLDRLKIDDNSYSSKHVDLFSIELNGFSTLDTVITLNYDLIIENSLRKISDNIDKKILPPDMSMLNRMYRILGKTQYMGGEGATLYHDIKDFGFYLKLHGSIDWLYCPNNLCGNHQQFFPTYSYKKDKKFENPDDPCILCGSPLASVIVPPTLHKSFEKFPKLGLIWSLAHKELNNAKKIIIIGVSFAESDYYLRWLFKSALFFRKDKPEIGILNSDQSICTLIENITGIKPYFFGEL